MSGLLEFETSECAIGFATLVGKNYGLESFYPNEKYEWPFAAHGSKEIFHVKGIVGPAVDDFQRYDVAGVINITSVVRPDGTISIYEVYDRHTDQLSEILDEISNRTGGGYSIWIDVGCDGPEQASQGEGSCIVIELENDLPELSSKIPRNIEGYKVDVIVLENR